MAKGQKRKNNFITVELFGMVFALFSAIVFLCLITGDSLFPGGVVRKFFLGSLGYLSYPCVLTFIYWGIKALIGFKLQNQTVKRIFKYCILYLLFISLLLQTILTPVNSAELSVYASSCYQGGASFSTCTVGGVVIGFLLWCICEVITPVGAYVLYGMVLCLVTVIMLRNTIADGFSEIRENNKDRKKKSKNNKTSKANKQQKTNGENDGQVEFETGEQPTKKQRTLGISDDEFELKSAKDKRREKDKQYSLDLMFGKNNGFNSNSQKVYNSYNDFTIDLNPTKSYQNDYDADLERKTEYVRRPSAMQGISVNSPMGNDEQEELYNSGRGNAMDIDFSEVEKETYVVNNGGRSRENIPAFDRMRGADGENYSNYSNGERYEQTDFLGGSNDWNNRGDTTANQNYGRNENGFGDSRDYSRDYNGFGERNEYNRNENSFSERNEYNRNDNNFGESRNYQNNDGFSSERYNQTDANYNQTSNESGRLHDMPNYSRGGFGSDLGSRASFEPTGSNQENYGRGNQSNYDRGGYENDRFNASQNNGGYISEEDARRQENLRRLRGENYSSQPEQLFPDNQSPRNERSNEVLKKLSRAGRTTGAYQNTNLNRGSKNQGENGQRIEHTERITENNYTERVYVPNNNTYSQGLKQPEVNVTINNVTEQKVQPEKTVTPAPKQISMADIPEERQLVNPIDKMPVNYRFHFPPLKLLEDYLPDEEMVRRNRIEQERRKETIVSILNQVNINPTIEDVKTGPTITRFEISIPHTVPIRKVLEKQKDLNLWLAAREEIRMIAPIPKTTRIGIEVPNATSTIVGLKSIIASKQFKEASNNSLICCLGKDTVGNVVLSNISEMPHLLVAGATGTGKSVFLNCMLVSLMYKYTPEELRIVIVDPKIVGFSAFQNIPHLLFNEIITEQKKALSMLEWAVKEMNDRYQKFGECLVDNIKDYNTFMNEKKGKKMFRILIIIDEFADLMASASDRKLMENKITRLAAKARAAGIHLIFAAQRPSADVVDGSIKTNFTSRMAFKMASAIDAQVVMGETGAEKLLGYGDVLHRTGKMSFTERAQGALIEKPEIIRVCTYLRENNKCYYDEFALEAINKGLEDEVATADVSSNSGGMGGDGPAPRNDDEIIKQAMRIAILTNNVSGSMLQRKLGLGYPKAAKIMDMLMAKGYVGAPIDNRHREILMDREQFKQVFGEDVDAVN